MNEEDARTLAQKIYHYLSIAKGNKRSHSLPFTEVPGVNLLLVVTFNGKIIHVHHILILKHRQVLQNLHSIHFRYCNSRMVMIVDFMS